MSPPKPATDQRDVLFAALARQHRAGMTAQARLSLKQHNMVSARQQMRRSHP